MQAKLDKARRIDESNRVAADLRRIALLRELEVEVVEIELERKIVSYNSRDYEIVIYQPKGSVYPYVSVRDVLEDRLVHQSFKVENKEGRTIVYALREQKLIPQNIV